MPKFASAEMEEAFWESDDRNKLGLRIVFLAVAIVTVAALGSLDRLAGGDAAPLMLGLRVITCVLMGVILFRYVRRSATPKARDRLVFLFGFVVGGLIILTTEIAPRPAADFYPFLLSATMVYGGTLVMPRFSTMAQLCVLTNVAYWSTVPVSQTSPAAIYANLFIITVTSFSVVIGAFTREKLERAQYLRQTELAEARRSAIESRDAALSASRAKSHLLANVSHELRTPMNAILGFSDIMKRQMFGPLGQPQYQSYANDIHNAGTLLQSSINDLLDVSRLEVGKMSWTDEWVPLSQLTARAISTCQRDAEAAGINLRDDLDDPEALMFCDPDRMAQILVNLITNAIKFSEAGSSITLSCRSAPGQAFISVKDEGCGIAAKDIDRICEPFGQVDANSATAQKGGLGLGLSIVRGLLSKFDSELSIESEVGVGTTVSLTIPDERIARRSGQVAGAQNQPPHLYVVPETSKQAVASS